MSNQDLSAYTHAKIRETSETVEEYLIHYSRTMYTPFFDLGSCMSDVGLRIRPFLFRISSEAGDIPFKDIVPVAAGIEMVQLSTLVIDDIIDQSPLRNNRPSIFAEQGYGESISIGTILFTQGLSLIADGLLRNEVFKNCLSIIRVLCDTHATIYFGQILDYRLEGCISTNEHDYLDMISKTTACFIQAPLVMGAMLWDAPQENIKHLKVIGYALGMAYQIRDDVIDIIGDSECTGKPIAGDIRRCKMRLPVIRALIELGQADRNHLENLLSISDLPDNSVREAIDLVMKTDAINYCISRTQQFCDQARDFIHYLPENVKELKIQLDFIADLISTFND